MAAQPDYIDIVLDKGGQRRLALEPIRWHCNGQDWDQEFSEDAYHDAETGLVFLRPAYYYPAWLTSNSGIYQKYRKADYTLTTSGSWNEHTASGAGNYFLASSDVNEAVTTSAVLGAVNQAMIIAWFVWADGAYAGNTNDGTRLECGWGAAGSADNVAYCSLKIYPSGKVQVYRYNVLIGESDLFSPESGGGSNSRTKQGGQGMAQPKSFQAFALRPMLGGLLVTCTQTGRSKFFSFPDIDVDASGDESTTIVPNTTFWWWVRNPAGATTNVQADVQLAKLQCSPTATIISNPIYLTEPPGPNRPIGVPTVVKTLAGATLTIVGEDGVTPYNSITGTVFRVKLALTGTYANTALWYAQGGWRGYSDVTDGSEEIRLLLDSQEDTDDQGGAAITSLSMSFPDAIGGARASMTLRNPQRIADDHDDPLIREQANRALLIRFGEDGFENPIIDGRTDAPITDDHWNEDQETIEIHVTDAWKAFENYRFPSRWSLASYTFAEALEFVVEATGAFNSDASPPTIDIEEVPDFTLPSPGIQADDSMEPMIKVGDTAADWVQRLMDDYAPFDFARIVPRPGGSVFVFRRIYE